MSGEGADRRVAIIGMAGRFPGAPDLDAFWRVIAEGRDTLTRFEVEDEPSAVDAPRASEQYVKARGVLEGIEDFDAEFFDLKPGEAAQIDPQHRLWLEVAWEALEAAGYARSGHGAVVSMYAGSFPSTYLHNNLLRDRAAVEEFVRLRRAQSFALLVQNDPAFLASRAAYKLDLRGPAINVQSACSTSLVAVTLAAQGLLSFEADVAVAGGVCVAVPQRTGYFVQEGAIHSHDGTCRPYDAAATGTVFGNGAGAVVLKRLADAERDGDPIHAVILGAAVNNDGRGKVSYSAPSVQGQAEVIAAAQVLAGVDPGTIGYVEGHGTATPMGDPIEVEALKLAFRGAGGERSCCLGSVKGNVGHLDAAAGVAGLMRAVLALRHRQLPATAHFTRPNPELRLDGSPFFVNPETTPWPDRGGPRRAAVSSFGIGGTNAHVILEEWRAPQPLPREAEAGEETTLLLSARSRAALDGATERLAAWLEAGARDGRAPRPLAEIAVALRDRRRRFDDRRAVRVSSWADACRALRDPARWDSGTALEGPPKVVFAFPGQGSLRPGAMARLLEAEPALRRHFEALARPAGELAGFDLVAWATDPRADPEPLRRDNAKAQLAIFAVDVALARWLEDAGVRADGFVGHSLGEWAGAHLAGILGLEDALRGVQRRGALMQASGPGAAIAVRLPEAAVARYLDGEVSVACVNGPELCLLSGRPEAIARCAARLSADGVASRALPIDVAVHSPHMDPVVEGLRGALATLAWRAPERPLLSSVTGSWLPPAQAMDVEYWATQPRRAVRFDAAVSTLLAEPRCLVLEVGLGDALTGLVRTRLREPRRHRALALVGAPRDGEIPGDRLRRAVNELWASGVELDVVGAAAPGAEAPVLPTYAFQRRRCWKEAPARVRDALAPAGSGPEGPGAATGPAPLAGGDRRAQLVETIHAMSGLPREALDTTVPFSSLGLDSLFLVQLAEELTARVGMRVSFAQLSQFNTIDALAGTLPKAPDVLRLPARAHPAASEGPSFRGLYPIRRGDGRLPMLLIHGDTANDLLPRALPPEQPIWGYTHQGADGDRIELRSVRALARRCFEEWIAAEHGKPCIVAGHSYGGLVAHEVTRLLREAGHEVVLLVILDTLHPRALVNPFPRGVRRLRRSARIALTRAGFAWSVARARLAFALRRRVPIHQRHAYLMSTYELAVRAHTPAPLDVEALLFRATGAINPVPARGWKASDFARLSLVEVPGTHLGIVRSQEAFQPIADVLARRVRQLRDGGDSGAPRAAV